MSYDGCACWWAEPTELVRRSLRVVEGAEGCCPASPWHIHHASVDLPGEFAIEWSERDGYGRSYRGQFEADPAAAWPAECAFCGCEFGPLAPDLDGGTTRYTDVARLYLRGDGAFVAIEGPNGEGGRGPAGMLTHADWMPFGRWTDRYGDGINLLAVCPNGGLWHVDGPAWRRGQEPHPDAWQRTGDPRHPQDGDGLVVSPSIIAGDYHGFIGQNAPPGHFSAG